MCGDVIRLECDHPPAGGLWWTGDGGGVGGDGGGAGRAGRAGGSGGGYLESFFSNLTCRRLCRHLSAENKQSQ